MTARILLAGPSCVGKTTVAQALARRGWRVVHVGTRKCWHVGPVAHRQHCYLSAMREALRSCQRGCVVDNAPLSVYGYTVALGADAYTLHAVLIDVLRTTHQTVLLVADARTLEERSRGATRCRLLPSAVHYRAMAVMESLALELGIPVVDASTPPDTVVREVLRRALADPRPIP